MQTSYLSVATTVRNTTINKMGGFHIQTLTEIKKKYMLLFLPLTWVQIVNMNSWLYHFRILCFLCFLKYLLSPHPYLFLIGNKELLWK